MSDLPRPFPAVIEHDVTRYRHSTKMHECCQGRRQRDPQPEPQREQHVQGKKIHLKNPKTKKKKGGKLLEQSVQLTLQPSGHVICGLRTARARARQWYCGGECLSLIKRYRRLASARSCLSIHTGPGDERWRRRRYKCQASLAVGGNTSAVECLSVSRRRTWNINS